MRDLKFYVIGLLILMANQNSIAQDDKKVGLAFTVSPSTSWLASTNTGYASEGGRVGIKYGLHMDFRLFGDDNYSLASGFTMNHLGGKLSEPTYVTNSNGNVIAARDMATYKLTYIDVPFAIRLKTNEIGYNIFYGLFGTELGFNVNAKKEYSTSYNGTTNATVTEDVSGDINLFRTSMIFGAGIERNISGDVYYRIGITYHNGLNNIMKGKAYAVDGNENTIVENNKAQEDKDLSIKLKFIELNLAIVF